MAIATWLTLAEAISTDTCEAFNSPTGYIVAPCGLAIRRDVEIPGAFWPAIQHVHEKHHEDGRHDGPWRILESVSHDGATVTITFKEEA